MGKYYHRHLWVLWPPPRQDTADWKAILLSALQPQPGSMVAGSCSLRKSLTHPVTLSMLKVLRSCLAELGTNLFCVCTNAYKAQLLWWLFIVLCSKSGGSCLLARAGKCIESIYSVKKEGQLGLTWSRPNLAGKGAVMPWCGRWVLSQAVSTPVLSTEPLSPGSPSSRRGVLLKNAGVPCHLGFSWALADKEGRLCIPEGSWEAILLLASTARRWSFHVALQGRYQPLCTPASALVSPPHPGFEEQHTAFCSNGYFLFVYADNN